MNRDIVFLENFYTLLNSGYSIDEALELCFQMLNQSFILKMIEELKQGEDIYCILFDHSFPSMFLEYLTFYKNKNCLSEAIEKSLQAYKIKERYKNELKSKLTYPVILLVFLFFFSLFVVFILLPKVSELFLSFQIEKSLFMEIVFSIFYFLPVILIILFSIVVISFVRLFYALKKKKHHIIEQYLNIPYIQLFIKKYFSLKFCIYYQELVEEDIDTATIIHLLNQQMNNSDIKIVLYEINNRLYEGERIEDILKDFEYFDQLFITFFQMFIKNPQQHYSLEKYIEITHFQIDYWISQLLKYLIPIIYGFVATFVITIYVSIIIPMMNVVSEI